MKALAYRTETVIHRPPEEVFEFCSDLRSELQWNPKVKYVEKLTDGPVGVGTRYRARGPTAGRPLWRSCGSIARAGGRQAPRRGA
jgi:uncharacterized protein YndB with AHSA1/START domain